jgi:hypothetical protein
MKKLFLILTMAMSLCVVQAQTSQAQTAFSIQTSTVSQLLSNPAAKAIFVKYFPAMAANPDPRGMDQTLPALQQYVPDLTNEKLAAMDAELKAVPK